MFNNLMISRVMKRVFVLMMVALMSAVMVNAKTIRGYVSDKDGNPVVGMKMVIVNVDSPSRKSVAVSVQVPDNLDTSDLVDMFASNGSRIIRYRQTSTGLRIVLEPARKTERVLAQK